MTPILAPYTAERPPMQGDLVAWCPQYGESIGIVADPRDGVMVRVCRIHWETSAQPGDSYTDAWADDIEDAEPLAAKDLLRVTNSKEVQGS